MTIVGETGTLWAPDVRDDAGPVFLAEAPPSRVARGIRTRLHRMKSRIEAALDVSWSVSGPDLHRRVRQGRRLHIWHAAPGKPVDFMLGPAELAEAIRDGRPCRLSAELGLHLTELIETLQYPERFDRPRVLCTSLPRMEPLPSAG